MKKSKRAVDRLGFIRVQHKDSGKTYPISPKIFNNKARMEQLGYIEIIEPEAPYIPPNVNPVQVKAPVDEYPENGVKVINPVEPPSGDSSINLDGMSRDELKAIAIEKDFPKNKWKTLGVDKLREYVKKNLK